MNRRHFLKGMSNAVCFSMLVPDALKQVLGHGWNCGREDTGDLATCLFSPAVIHLEENGPPSLAPLPGQKQTVTGAGIGYVIATVNDLVNYSWNAVDPGDVAQVLESGKVARLTVGTAAGPAKARTAVSRTLSQLEARGVAISEATGVLMCINATSEMARGGFDEVSAMVRAAVAENTNVVSGLVLDDTLGRNIKLSMVSVYV